MVELKAIYASLPAVERGRGILIGGDPASSTIAYCNGRSVILRNLDDPMNTEIYTGHSYPTTVARFSPNGHWVASGDTLGNVRVWARKAEFDYKLKFELRAISGSVDDLQWSPDGQRILVAGDGKGSHMVRCFMWDSGNNVGEFDGHSRRVTSCSFRPVRPFRIATGGEDRVVNFYEGPPFRFSVSNREHSNFVNCVRFSPDGSKFFSVASDRRCFIYDGKSGAKIGELPGENGHTGSIYAASWSPNSNQLLTVSADKTAKIWDISEDGSGTLSRNFLFEDNAGIDFMQMGCLWLPKYIVTVSLNGDINYLSTEDLSAPFSTISGHVKFITTMSVVQPSTNEFEIYSSSYDGLIVRWRRGKGGMQRLSGKGRTNSVKKLVVAGDKLLSFGLDSTILLTPLPAEKYSEEEPMLLKSQPKDISVAAADPEVVLCATTEGLELLRGGIAVSFLTLAYEARAVGLSPDGLEAVVGSIDGKLHIYSVKGDTLIEVATLEKHRAAITCIAFSPDGSLFSSCDEKPEVVVWDSGTREIKVKNMLYHTARATCLAWSPDGSLLASGSLDSSAIVWDVSKPASSRLTFRHAHPGGVNAVAFKDKNTLVTAGDDACIREWSIP